MPVHHDAAVVGPVVESVIAQTLPTWELVLVLDRPDDATREVVARLAAGDRRVRVGTSQRDGVAAARNRGVELARGRYLVFWDADDVVPRTAAERLVGSLEASGSDLVVGAATVQELGRHRPPPWAAGTTPRRETAAGLHAAPYVSGNILIGAYAFRAAFWDDAGLRFDPGTDHGDLVVIARALRRARSVDAVTAVVHRACQRTDRSSLSRRAERERDRAGHVVRSIVGAVQELGSSPAAQVALHSAAVQGLVAPLVRASVTNGPDYWRVLSRGVAELSTLAGPHGWETVPVEERVLAWLCGRDLREATEELLMYVVENATGFPTGLVDGHPELDLAMLADISDKPPSLTALERSDLRFRNRLHAVRWEGPHLVVVGMAIVEYLSALVGCTTTVVLRRAGTGEVRRFATSVVEEPELEVNKWAARAHEDHSRGGFRCAVDVSELGGTDRSAAWEVEVELEAAGHTWCEPFQSRARGGSAGLLERTHHADVVVTPTWRDSGGLRIGLEPAGAPDEPARGLAEHGAGPRVVALEAQDGPGGPVVVLSLDGVEPGVEVALAGPRSGTPYAPCRAGAQDGSPATVRVTLPLTQDDWGVGRAVLPADVYRVSWRTPHAEGSIEPDVALWRDLPLLRRAGDLEVLVEVGPAGALRLRVRPVEWRTARSAYERRQMRDQVYPAAREGPLRRVAFFESFHGLAGGDNPGAICEAFARRGLDLDLAFSVDDRSVVLPAGARPVVRQSREYFELLGSAELLVVNASTPQFLRARPDQVVMQTWHGTPLKRIAHDRVSHDFNNWQHQRQISVAQRSWGLMLSQGEFCSGALRSAFRYDGTVLELGYPRNDVLTSPDAPRLRQQTRRRLGIPERAFVVLYAPTWRDDQRVGRVFEKVLYLDPHEVVAGIDDAVVLVRGHYNSMRAAEDEHDDGRVLDVTRYPDISHLYLAADALVTDYSSVFFDFAIVDKPMAFLAPDLVQYRDENRGFYLDYHDTVPGVVCDDTAAVVEVLRGEDREAARRAEFRRRFTPLDDGSASDRAVDALLARAAVTGTTSSYR